MDTVVLYDADCGFCKWSVNVLLRWDRRRRLRPVAIQSGEGQRLLADVPPGGRLQSAHAVLADGTLLSGGAAAPSVLRLLPGGGLPAAVLARFPAATDRAYRFVAEHRAGFGRLARADPGAEVRRRRAGSLTR